MYSFEPLHTPIVSQYTAIAICVFLFLLIAYSYLVWDEGKWKSLTAYAIASVLSVFAIHNALPPEVPKNIKMTGTFVEFIAQRETSSHKNTQSTTEKFFVVYAVNGQRVILSAHTQYSYPSTAVIYYNPKE